MELGKILIWSCLVV
uniref:Uncharacterized protein n=1 Tax=Rhizophora mucronata TaxID=61149 RepID=A0A2P2QAX9_RHIMU